MGNGNFNSFSNETVISKIKYKEDLDFKNLHHLLHLRKLKGNMIFIRQSKPNKFKGTLRLNSVEFEAFVPKTTLENSFGFLRLYQMQQI